MWHCVGLLRTGISGERVTSIFSVKKVCERITALAVGWKQSQHLHGATAQKMAFFIVTTMKTSNAI
jgi:hypothetical protein